MTSLDPWRSFANKHQRHERIVGKITDRIDDLGIFVELENGIFGIVHLNDIDADLSGELAIKKYAVGDCIEVVILAINIEGQRVSLGIKQLRST